MGTTESQPERVGLLRGYYDIDEVGQSASSAHLSRVRRQARCAVCCYTCLTNCRLVFTWKLMLVLCFVAAAAIIMWCNRDNLEEYFYRKDHHGVPA